MMPMYRKKKGLGGKPAPLPPEIAAALQQQGGGPPGIMGPGMPPPDALQGPPAPGLAPGGPDPKALAILQLIANAKKKGKKP